MPSNPRNQVKNVVVCEPPLPPSVPNCCAHHYVGKTTHVLGKEAVLCENLEM